MGETKNCTKCSGAKFTKDLEGNVICAHCGANYGLRTDIAASTPHSFWPEANRTRLETIDLDLQDEVIVATRQSPVWIYFLYLLLVIPMTIYDIARVINNGVILSQSVDLMIGVTVWSVAALLRFWQFAEYEKKSDLFIALMAAAVVIIKLANLLS